MNNATTILLLWRYFYLYNNLLKNPNIMSGFSYNYEFLRILWIVSVNNIRYIYAFSFWRRSLHFFFKSFLFVIFLFYGNCVFFLNCIIIVAKWIVPDIAFCPCQTIDTCSGFLELAFFNCNVLVVNDSIIYTESVRTHAYIYIVKFALAYEYYKMTVKFPA